MSYLSDAQARQFTNMRLRVELNKQKIKHRSLHSIFAFSDISKAPELQKYMKLWAAAANDKDTSQPDPSPVVNPKAFEESTEGRTNLCLNSTGTPTPAMSYDSKFLSMPVTIYGRNGEVTHTTHQEILDKDKGAKGPSPLSELDNPMC